MSEEEKKEITVEGRLIRDLVVEIPFDYEQAIPIALSLDRVKFALSPEYAFELGHSLMTTEVPEV